MDQLQEIIVRIQQMEAILDTLQEAFRRDPGSVWQDETLRDLLRQLTAYYDGAQWLRDYETDEAGLLPKDLKRGVLSEDAVYNFLADISRIKEE